MLRGLERREVSTLPEKRGIGGLLDALLSVNGRIRTLNEDRRNGRRVPRDEEQLQRLHITKHLLLLALLERRQAAISRGDLSDPAAKVEVRISKFSDEEFHPFSRNGLQVDFWLASKKQDKLCQTRTFLHQLAASGNLGNSLVVLGRIGEPTAYLEESPDDYVKRVFSEVRAIDAALGKVRADISPVDPLESEKTRQALDEWKVSLAMRVLAIRAGYPLDPQIEVGRLGSTDHDRDLIELRLGDSRQSFRILAPERYPLKIGGQLETLIERGGDYTFSRSRGDRSSPFVALGT